MSKTPYAGGNTLAPVDAHLTDANTTGAYTAYATGGKANATPITTTNVRITVCATAADSVLLPAATVGKTIYIQNNGVASAQVFGAGTDTINSVATGTGVAHANAKFAMYRCMVAGAWERILSA